MSIAKSFSVGNGDMFYIKHGSDNFTMIDCNLKDDRIDEIIEELKKESKGKSVHRFVSTHPDEDHIHGLESLLEREGITNFYCVFNEATKSDETESFKAYCGLRDGEKSFHIHQGCSRKWKNLGCEERGSSGLNTLRPILANEDYQEELVNVKNGKSPNNISPIMSYGLENSGSIMRMGDLEEKFMEKIIGEVDLPKISVLFAPHHGRKSGRVPKERLEKMNPDVIVIGEAPSAHLDYSRYDGYNKITQHSAGDITFDLQEGKIHIYSSNESYEVDFLQDDVFGINLERGNYIGTLMI